MKFLKLLFLLWMCCVAGCGFWLRNNTEIPPVLRVIYIKSSTPYSAFLADLRQNFSALGICMTKCPGQAPVTLDILSEKFRESRITISATSLLSQYLLLYEVSYQLEDAKGCVLVPARTIAVTRNYTVNANAVLGAGNEIPLLQQDMRREVVYQLINQLSSGRVIRACLERKLCC
jgi:LPS-assembly lipoprotein